MVFCLSCEEPPEPAPKTDSYFKIIHPTLSGRISGIGQIVGMIQTSDNNFIIGTTGGLIRLDNSGSFIDVKTFEDRGAFKIFQTSDDKIYLIRRIGGGYAPRYIYLSELDYDCESKSMKVLDTLFDTSDFFKGIISQQYNFYDNSFAMAVIEVSIDNQSNKYLQSYSIKKYTLEGDFVKSINLTGILKEQHNKEYPYDYPHWSFIENGNILIFFRDRNEQKERTITNQYIIDIDGNILSEKELDGDIPVGPAWNKEYIKAYRDVYIYPWEDFNSPIEERYKIENTGIILDENTDPESSYFNISKDALLIFESSGNRSNFYAYDALERLNANYVSPTYGYQYGLSAIKTNDNGYALLVKYEYENDWFVSMIKLDMNGRLEN
jgi:hypothetical protein